MATDSPQNPFSTGRIRPGAIPYLFSDGTTLESLADRLEKNRWCGEIIGPHGTGKSTLLAHLAEVLKTRGKRLAPFTIHRGEKPKPMSSNDWDHETLVVVDGAEQMWWFARWGLRRHCKQRKSGLLWTTHRSLGLPLLWRTQPDEQITQRVVSHLLEGTKVSISPEEVSEAFRKNKNNCRETLFRLYDLFQNRARRL